MFLFEKTHKTALHKVWGPKSIQMAKFPEDSVPAFTDLYCFCLPQMRKDRSSCKALIKIGAVKLLIYNISIIVIHVCQPNCGA